MKIYFRKHKVGNPGWKIWNSDNHFNWACPWFAFVGHNNGIQIGFITPFFRNWWHVEFVYNRFYRKADR